MFACTVTALKSNATQLLYLHGHITLSMQIMQVYETASSSVVGVCRHSRKVTEYLGREVVQKCQTSSMKALFPLGKWSYFGMELHTKPCARAFTHMENSTTPRVCCEPFTCALLASIPIHCWFFWYLYHRWIQKTERYLSCLYCVQQCYWIVNSHQDS